MKKTLIALALASLPVASMADVVLYGTIGGGVEVTKVSGTAGTVTNIVDYGSKIGFKGHEHLTNDLSAIWQLESRVDIAGDKYPAALDRAVDANNSVYKGSTGNDFGTYDSFVGLKSNTLGTVKAGWQGTPVKDLNGKLDIWSRDDLGSVYGANGASAAGLDVFGRGTDARRRAVAVSYETPKFAGVSAKAYVSPSDTAGLENGSLPSDGDFQVEDRAIYGLSASYAQPNGGFFADVAGTYARAHDGSANFGNKDGFQALAQLGYENDQFLAGVAYQYTHDVDSSAVGAIDRSNEVLLTGAYNLTEALRLKASAVFGWGFKNKVSGEKIYGNGKYYQGIVGADYALSKRTVVNGQVGYLQFGRDTEGNKYGTVSVGLTHNF
jgi:predicted porin